MLEPSETFIYRLTKRRYNCVSDGAAVTKDGQETVLALPKKCDLVGSKRGFQKPVVSAKRPSAESNFFFG